MTTHLGEGGERKSPKANEQYYTFCNVLEFGLLEVRLGDGELLINIEDVRPLPTRGNRCSWGWRDEHTEVRKIRAKGVFVCPLVARKIKLNDGCGPSETSRVIERPDQLAGEIVDRRGEDVVRVDNFLERMSCILSVDWPFSNLKECGIDILGGRFISSLHEGFNENDEIRGGGTYAK